MSTTFATLYAYAKRRLLDRSDTTAVSIAKQCVNDALRLIAEDDHDFFRERGYISVTAPYSSGTVAVAKDASYCSLVAASGGTWVSAYSGRMIIIDENPVHLEATITSNVNRITFGESGKWVYAAETGASYVLYSFEYALPSDFRRMGTVLDEDMLCDVAWMNDFDEFETYRLENYASTGPPDVACIANDKLMLWPYPDDAQIIPLPYYRWPAVMTANSDVMDFPDTGGNLLLVYRAIDYMAEIEMGRDPTAAAGRYLMQRDSVLRYSHNRVRRNLLMGGADARVIRVTKIVGSDSA